MQIGVTVPRGNGIKRSTLRVRRSKSRSHEAKIGHKIHFGEISKELSNEFLKNLAGTYYGKCPLYHNNSDAEGQMSGSYEAEDRFGCPSEASFSTP